MDFKLKHKMQRPRGVAMFVVLGVIVIVSLLGYAGLKLAENDVGISGSHVDQKSQRLTAIAGLDMAVARLSSSDAVTATLLNDFKASVTSGTPRQWILFSGNNLSLSGAEPDFTPIGSDKSACKVKILGVQAIGSATTLDVTLESTGRGRSGDIHKVVATYRMTGLNNFASTNSNGPTNGLLSIGGYNGGGVNLNLTVDGGIYGGDGELRLQSNSGGFSTRIRTSGNVTLNQDYHVLENSVIGGELNTNGHSFTVDANLLLKGNLQNGHPVNVGGSMIFHGQTVSGHRDGTINIGKDFLVDNYRFVTEGKLSIGTNGTTTARAWFSKGINVSQTATSLPDFSHSRVIHGSMYVGNDDGGGDWLRQFRVEGNLRYQVTAMASATAYLRVNDVLVDGNFYSNGTMKGGANSISGGDGITVGQYATVGLGFDENNKQNHTFKGNVYWKATGQLPLATPGNGAFNFEKNLSMNGTQDNSWNGRWSFTGAGRYWTYTSSSTYPCSPLREKLHMANALGVGCRASDSAIPDWVGAAPIPINAVTDLGFTAADTDVTPGAGINVASAVTLANLSNMSNAWNRVTRPTASEIVQKYNNERAAYLSNPSGYTGPLCAGVDGQYKFLVINITSDWSIGGAPTDLNIPSGVHVMFIFNASQSGMNSWYTNSAGSTQIVIFNQNPSGFGWTGTIYGFIQYRVANQGQMQINGGNKILFGAIESQNPTSKIHPNSGSLTIYNNVSSTTTGTQVRAVIDKIAMAFTSRSAPTVNATTGAVTYPSDDVIRFNGDNSNAVTVTQRLTTNDGWVQFQRIGEFR